MNLSRTDQVPNAEVKHEISAKVVSHAKIFQWLQSAVLFLFLCEIKKIKSCQFQAQTIQLKNPPVLLSFQSLLAQCSALKHRSSLLLKS